MIVLDAINGTMDVELSDEELVRRRTAWTAREMPMSSGYLWKYAQTVGPAKDGGHHPGGAQETQTYADI